MTQGGARAGAGRKKGSLQGFGSLSKENQEIVKSCLAQNAAYGASTQELPEDISPLELLLHVMRNNHAPMSIRVQAATVAAPYVHPKLTSSKVTVHKESNLQEILDAVRVERDRMTGTSAKVLDHKEVIDSNLDLFNTQVPESILVET